MHGMHTANTASGRERTARRHSRADKNMIRESNKHIWRMHTRTCVWCAGSLWIILYAVYDCTKDSSLSTFKSLPSKYMSSETGAYAERLECKPMRALYSNVVIFINIETSSECQDIPLRSCVTDTPASGSHKSALLVGKGLADCGLTVYFTNESANMSTVCAGIDCILRRPSSMDSPDTRSLAIIHGSMSDTRLRICELYDFQRLVFVGTNSGKEYSQLSGGLMRFQELIIKYNMLVAGKSHYHAAEMQFRLKTKTFVLYNPVSEYAYPRFLKASDVLKSKFIYISAPSKAMRHACKVLSALKRYNENVWMVSFRPKYAEDSSFPGACSSLITDKTLIIKEPASFAHILDEVSSSFSVLFPGGFVETFGNAHFESNCVGTPVLAEATGSLPEILQNPEAQLLPRGASIEDYVRRIKYWWTFGRPVVTCHTDKTLLNTMTPFFSELLSSVSAEESRN